MKNLLAIVAVSLLLVSACKKDEDPVNSQFISQGADVTPEMYAFLKGSWTYKNPPSAWNWGEKTKLTFLNNSMIFISNDGGGPGTGTYKYELRKWTAANTIHYWVNASDTTTVELDEIFTLKGQSFWLGGLQGLEMRRKL